MLLLLLLLVGLGVAGIAGTVHAVARDGYRAVPTDRSRLP